MAAAAMLKFTGSKSLLNANTVQSVHRAKCRGDQSWKCRHTPV